ncbi:hypothetical protein KKB55_07555 [Myxococcota bacterium]|nr:hypothetical protein [Myxococcota bacterium]MBU1897612.1 hypothetical protein [Myxococcota bacterium]
MISNRIYSKILWSTTLLFGFFLILGLSAQGCNQDKKKLNEIHISISSDSGNFNPLHSNFSSVGHFIEGPLMRYSSKGGKPFPYIASAISSEANGLQWVIELAPNRMFYPQDKNMKPEPIKLEDVAESIRAAATKKGNPKKGLFDQGGYEKVEIRGDKIIVHFKNAWTPAETLLSMITVWPADMIKNLDPMAILNFSDVAGAGPYRIAEYQPNARALLQPTGQGENIVLDVQNPDAGAQAFKEGKAHIIYAEPVHQKIFKNLPNTRVLIYPYKDLIAITSRCVKPGSSPACNPVFREAIFKSINADLIQQLATRGLSLKSNGRIHAMKSHEDYNSPISNQLEIPFDLESAKKLLDDQGYKIVDGKRMLNGNPLKISIATYNEISEYNIILDRVVHDLKKDLNIDVIGNSMRSVDFRKSIMSSEQKFDFWIGEYPRHMSEIEPSISNSIHSKSTPSNGGLNYAFLDSDEIDQLAVKTDSVQSHESRKIIFHELHNALLKQMIFKGLYFVKDGYAVQCVNGIDDNDPYIQKTIYSWPDTLSLNKNCK